MFHHGDMRPHRDSQRKLCGPLCLLGASVVKFSQTKVWLRMEGSQYFIQSRRQLRRKIGLRIHSTNLRRGVSLLVDDYD
jgi:hypothetical protein